MVTMLIADVVLVGQVVLDVVLVGRGARPRHDYLR
jgi:hypothetical protein